MNPFYTTCITFEYLEPDFYSLQPADEDKWNDLLRNGLTYGGGSVQSEDFFKAIARRIERTLMRTVRNFFFIYAVFILAVHATKTTT